MLGSRSLPSQSEQCWSPIGRYLTVVPPILAARVLGRGVGAAVGTAVVAVLVAALVGAIAAAAHGRSEAAGRGLLRFTIARAVIAPTETGGEPETGKSLFD